MAQLTNLEIENLATKILKGNTAKAVSLYESFLRGSCSHINHAYERPSQAKLNAFEYCIGLELKCRSNDGVITGHNTSTFSYAFTCESVEGATYLVYITKDNNYVVKYPALGRQLYYSKHE